MTVEIKVASEKDAEEGNYIVESSPHRTIFYEMWTKSQSKLIYIEKLYNVEK